MQLKNQKVIAAEWFGREENSSAVLIPTMSKGKDQQLKLAHKGVDVLDRANSKICVTLPRYSVDKPESSYGQIRLFVRKMEDEKFQQNIYVKYKFEKIVYLLDVLSSV